MIFTSVNSFSYLCISYKIFSVYPHELSNKDKIYLFAVRSRQPWLFYSIKKINLLYLNLLKPNLSHRNLMNEIYSKGVTKVFEELNEKMDELADLFN